MNKVQLTTSIDGLKDQIKNLQEELAGREADLKLLEGEDILPIGTEVRLVRNWNTSEDIQKRPDWRDFLYFMNSKTPAHIVDIKAYNGVVKYVLRFTGDDASRYVLDFERKDFKVLQSGGVLEKEIVKLKKENEDLKIRLNELTSPTDTKDCPHRFVSTCINTGEPKVFCRYYEGQPCDDTDFCNCMFRENTRLKEKFNRTTKTVEQLITLSDTLANICDLSLGITVGPAGSEIFMLSKKIQSRVHILGKLNTNL